ncbi:hypothetical protein LINGRAHAP2_LOCUS18787 [Linum grandiflorum]
MSVLRYPEDATAPPTMNSAAEMQIWNNAAFDDGESDDSTAKASSWWSQSVNSSSKENRNPAEEDGYGIDVEIEEIEKEIRRLSTRLEALRLKKQLHNAVAERRGKPAEDCRPTTPFPSSGMKPKISRRGFSLGPAEIASKARLFTKLETAAAAVTPVLSTASRRKSCFWKLGEIDELKVTKERGKSQSVSPKSRNGTEMKPLPVVKQQAQTTAAAVGKRPAKKEEGDILALIQPKTLFKEGDNSITSKKKQSSRSGRVVASRYNQIPAASATEDRKRSLPESDNDDGNKRRSASRRDGLLNVKVKKKWEIPSEVVIFKDQDQSQEEEEEEVSLAKIRTSRRQGSSAETPRDSGAAKRVAELVGKKSFFAVDEGVPVEESVCLALSYEE